MKNLSTLAALLALPMAICAKPTRIFLEGNEKNSLERAKHLVAQNNKWQLVDKAENADVILSTTVKRVLISDRSAYAVLKDAKTNEVLLQTKPVNTLTRFTFTPRKGVMNKLFRKRINGLAALDKY